MPVKHGRECIQSTSMNIVLQQWLTVSHHIYILYAAYHILPYTVHTTRMNDPSGQAGTVPGRSADSVPAPGRLVGHPDRGDLVGTSPAPTRMGRSRRDNRR